MSGVLQKDRVEARTVKCESAMASMHSTEDGEPKKEVGETRHITPCDRDAEHLNHTRCVPSLGPRRPTLTPEPGPKRTHLAQ